MTSQFEHRYFYVRETMIPVGIFAVPEGTQARSEMTGLFDAGISSVEIHNICKNANLMVEYSRVQPIEEIMKQSEFLRWLKSRGVEVTHGTRHLRLRVPGTQKRKPCLDTPAQR